MLFKEDEWIVYWTTLYVDCSVINFIMTLMALFNTLFFNCKMHVADYDYLYVSVCCASL